MAVHETSIIDFVSIDDVDTVILTIADQLDWTEIENHLSVLKEKINTYCKYIENGHLYDEYPETRDRRPMIKVMFICKPVAEAESFLERVKILLYQEGFLFCWAVLLPS